MIKRSDKKRFKSFIGILVIILGLGLFLYPDLKTRYLEWQTAGAVSGFQEQNRDGDQPPDMQDQEEPLAFDGVLPATDELMDAMRDYNYRIFKDGQADFKDAWSVAQAPEVLNGLGDGMFGYIEIPSMDVTLPLYIGASTDHMAKGAAILGETSIPIGGNNTNSVIAGHRGYRGVPYFRDIEKLSVGDPVYINNPWETLAYRVESIDIISPYASDAVKIQEGKDMVTLLTCHPYRSHGKYRYVVYCVRDEGMTAGSREPEKDGEYITASDGNVYAASQDDIQTEILLRRCGAIAIFVIVCFTFFTNRRRRDRKVRSQ